MPAFRLDPPGLKNVVPVREVLSEAGWDEVTHDGWDLRWMVGVARTADHRTAAGRFFNHLLGLSVLWLKDRFADTMAGAPFVPRTFVLPRDRDALLGAGAGPWIVKPRGSSKGRGVHVVGDAAKVEGDVVVQRYVESPRLIDGVKATLRLYLLLTSLDPLRAALFEDGIVRAASRPYTRGALDDPGVHLTNRREEPPLFRDRLARDVLDDATWAQLEALAAATARAAQAPALAHVAKAGVPQSGCFELLGLDVLLDAAGAPWLLECNLCPALTTDAEPRAAALKRQLLRATLAEAGALPPSPGFRPLHS